MPLTAKTVDDDMIIADDMYNADRSRGYKCRFCESDMTLVLPKKSIVKHFRHKVKSDCPHSGESMAHLEAKKYFYDLYNSAEWCECAEMEKIVGNRIGDVVVHTPYPMQDIVIELQNSPIREDEIWHRFHDWNADGYSMLWVITMSPIKQHAAQTTETRVPEWVRTLHHIYGGRVYTYFNNDIYSLHFEDVYRLNEWNGCEYRLKTVKDGSALKIGSDTLHNVNMTYRKITMFDDGMWWK